MVFRCAFRTSRSPGDAPKVLACLTLIGVLAMASGAAPGASLDVAVVLSGDSAPYTEMAQGISDGLERYQVGTARIISASDVGRLKTGPASIVVAVGASAARATARLPVKMPVLNALIPRAAYERIVRELRNADDTSQYSAVYLDQPVGRQLDLIRQIVPEQRRIGVIFGPDSADLATVVDRAARARGLQTVTARINTEEGLPAALRKVLADSGVLLSLPDAVVYNSRTVQSVLFTAYHFQVPVIGFSPAYVRAGALAAVHSTPRQLARQVVDILKSFDAASGKLPPPQYPIYFSVSVNEHVARSLEIGLDDEETLATKLRSSRESP